MYKLNAKELSWAVYDFGNSAYALIVMTLFFPIFFSKFINAGKFTPALWGISVAASLLIAGFASPILGALADANGKRKKYFIISSLLAIIGTAALSFSAQVEPYLGALIFVAVNSLFGVSLSLYDSFLSVVPQKKSVSTTLSGIGWSLGYIGGPLCLGIAYLMLGSRLPSALQDYTVLFITTAGFFLLCSVWPYKALPKDSIIGVSATKVEKNPFARIKKTLGSWRELKHIFVFLIATYFIMGGVTTVVYFISLYAASVLGFSLGQIVVMILFVQIVGIFATGIVCWLAEKIGETKMLVLCSFAWTAITVMIFFSHDYATFWWISALTGLVVGSTPAIARGFLGKNIPPEKRAELFGFNTFASRVATFAGPLLFGVFSSLIGMNFAILTLIPFFLAGAVLLFFVKAPNKNL